MKKSKELFEEKLQRAKEILKKIEEIYSKDLDDGAVKCSAYELWNSINHLDFALAILESNEPIYTKEDLEEIIS